MKIDLVKVNICKKELILCLIVILTLSSVFPVLSLNKPKNQDTITIKIKHHLPSDLQITVGQLKVNKDYKPSDGLDFKNAIMKDIPNQDLIQDDFSDFWIFSNSLKESGLGEALTPEKGNNIWFIKIEDHGTRYLKDKLTDQEIQETVNYLEEFSVTINDTTFKSREHSYFDDGGMAIARIFGVNEEIVDPETMQIKDISWDNAMGIIGISKKWHWTHEDFDPEIAFSAWAFNQMILDLSYAGIMPFYDYYRAIDYYSDWPPGAKYSPTHSKIYRQTIDSLLGNCDSETDGNDKVIIYIGAHGAANSGFCFYDSYFWGKYTEANLGGQIQAMTVEGTRIWCYLDCCQSDTFYPDSYYYHKNKVVYWTFDHETWTMAFYYTINATIKSTAETITRTVENIFPYVDEAYSNAAYNEEHEHMTQHDFDSEPFNLRYSNSYKTSFEEGPPLSNGWTNIAAPLGTDFTQDSYRKISGTYSGHHDGGSGSIFRSDKWLTPGTFTEGVLMGWVYNDHYNYYANSAIFPIYYNSQNYVVLVFYSNYVTLRSCISGTMASTSTNTQSWNNKWWQFEITIDGNSMIGWVKTGGTRYSLNAHSWSGSLTSGYVALESRVGWYGAYWYDDILCYH